MEWYCWGEGILIRRETPIEFWLFPESSFRNSKYGKTREVRERRASGGVTRQSQSDFSVIFRRVYTL